jgi:hypothetical protein
MENTLCMAVVTKMAVGRRKRRAAGSCSGVKEEEGSGEL